MNIGDVVVPRSGPFSGLLACGSGRYTHAICVSVEPFVMVSQEGDMMWTCQDIDDFIGLCKADDEVAKKAFLRFQKENGENVPEVTYPSINRYEEGLAVLYQRDYEFVARVCDEFIDRSGALLGRIRTLVRLTAIGKEILTHASPPVKPDTFPFSPSKCLHTSHTFWCNGCGLDVRNAKLAIDEN